MISELDFPSHKPSAGIFLLTFSWGLGYTQEGADMGPQISVGTWSTSSLLQWTQQNKAVLYYVSFIIPTASWSLFFSPSKTSMMLQLQVETCFLQQIRTSPSWVFSQEGSTWAPPGLTWVHALQTELVPPVSEGHSLIRSCRSLKRHHN